MPLKRLCGATVSPRYLTPTKAVSSEFISALQQKPGILISIDGKGRWMDNGMIE
jgi:hypothetical protein